MKKTTFALLTGLFFGSAEATLLFTESLNFGGSTGLWKDNTAATDVYSTTSSRHTYNATGLTHDQMTDEIGGMYTYEFTGGTNSVGPNTSTGAFTSGFTGVAGAGDTYWLATLVRWGGGTSSLSATLTNSTSVNSIGFKVNSTGQVLLFGSNGGAVAGDLATGAQTVVGETHLLLMRGTVGATGDASGPTTSILDFWFDPADVFALGAATYSTGADSKFGRSGNYTSVSLGGGSGSTSNVPALDEIRFGTDLNEMFVIPEPGTLALVGIALGSLLLFRRRKA